MLFCASGYSSPTDPQNAQYCLQFGGTVEAIPMVYHMQGGLINGEAQDFCEFNIDNGSAAVGLKTFASKKPSIAATYIKIMPTIDEKSKLLIGPYSNPSWNLCKNLGGVLAGYVVLGAYTNALGESDICVFGDGSMVSGWTLIYIANQRTGFDKIRSGIRSNTLFEHITDMPQLNP